MNARDTSIVLDINDPAAWTPLSTYAKACEANNPDQAADIRRRLSTHMQDVSEFIAVPDVELPDGRVIPSFMVSKYVMSEGPDETPVSVASLKPWHSISYHEARETTHLYGFGDFLLTQALAIAWDISRQNDNWTGGKVGEGEIFMGLHNGTVSEAQAADYVSPEHAERRWHRLSNGEVIFDFAGNIFTWLFDDLQGDDSGLTTIINADSITLRAPYPSTEKGMGWRPDGRRDWSGYALVRGGCWCSGSLAGVFSLYVDGPDRRYDYVGFRCTKPIGH